MTLDTSHPTTTTARQGEHGYRPVGAAHITGRSDAGVRVLAGDVTVEVTALLPGVFRVGVFGRGRPVNYPAEAVPAYAAAPGGIDLQIDDDTVELATDECRATIELAPLRIGFRDRDGQAFAVDDPELGMGFCPSLHDGELAARLGEAPRLHKLRGEGERYFGCGERTAGLEKTGSRQRFWNTNLPHGHTAALDNLYSAIPFVLSLQDGRAHGIFVDNPGDLTVDLAKADARRVMWSAAGGDLVYYVIHGPTPARVLAGFTALTGRTPMPPLWALGNHQSRWSYASSEEVLDVARRFREHDIPCDCLYLDIDYMDGFRVFTWDRDRFPEPAKLTQSLEELGFRLVTIVDPGVKVDDGYVVYEEGHRDGLFCRTSDDEEYVNAVWPGLCAFPDFTNARTRRWWGEQHRTLVDAGVAGVWCDMNEPAVMIPRSTMPPDVVHPGLERAQLHGEVHNLYGSQMARATREGLLELRPGQRPFVISRSGYAGLQRHALHWTGDNSSWWEHLWMSMPQLANLGLSGVAWVGVDVGGFLGDCDGELLARFTEFGVFQPFCRNHSAEGTARQEPWAFGEPWTTVCRKMIKLRMRLIPYLYGLFEESHRTGAPILRPLLYEHPDDVTTYTADDEVLLGRDLLLAPISRPGVEHRHVYLPAGTWVHWWSDNPIAGPAHVLAHAPLGEPALYARANTPIALWPERGHTGGPPPDVLTLRIAVVDGAAEGRAVLYEDEGDGFGYQDGVYSRRSVTCEAAVGGAIRVQIGAREGRWTPPRERVDLELRTVTSPPATVRVDGRDHAMWSHDETEQTLTVHLRELAGAQTIEIVASESACA
jgi:alpha-glucosidase